MSFPRSRVRQRVARALLVVLVGLCAGCGTRAARFPLHVVDAVIPREGRTYAILVNGGGRPETNYQSHLQHVKGVLALLETNGVRAQDIVIFSGDGADPAADLATRERSTEPDFWLLPQTTVGNTLHPLTLVDSAVDGMTLRPARKDALRAWFATDGVRLRRGDTLLFYVTDHGRKNSADLANNSIVLWGEELSVTELHDLFAQLDPRVRVAMVMSQCYAGSFAHAIFNTANDALPPGNVCGYFATTADRPAYGCYPENRGKDGVGHSYELLSALDSLGRLPEAEHRILVTDRTPDVPNSSADFFLEQLLQKKAKAQGAEAAAFADAWLAEAWQNRAAWEPEIRLLDRIGHTFGTFSPRSLGELEDEARALPDFSKQLDTYAERWQEALEALRLENFQRFVEAHPEWHDRLAPEALKALTPDELRTTAAALLAALMPFSQSDAPRYARLLSLKEKADEASAASYRAEVRLGSVLRMRIILISIAGRVYLARQGTPDERAAYERLVACEDLSIGKPLVASAADLPAPDPFPPLAEEQQLVQAVMPAWMGIRYQPVAEAQRLKYGTETGAVAVMTVYPDSPAVTAGLEAGDIILGPPGKPFVEPNQVREWTMRSEIGVPERLRILRDARPLQVTLRPAPFPVEMPKLPGPPVVGSLAPPLKIDLFRGTKHLADGKPRLLFFWATWCTICKSALPEVLAFGQARNVDVVAITDEDRDTLGAFLRDFQAPFPSIVGIDAHRVTFQNYGVSGFPTFVLVDGDGTVRSYQTGYKRQTGLTIDGWHWDQDSPNVPSTSP